MGQFVCAFGWPIVPLLTVAGIDVFEVPSRRTLPLIGVNAMIGGVLSDYLRARSVILTIPLIGTIVLSLTVPPSLTFDFWYKNNHITRFIPLRLDSF